MRIYLNAKTSDPDIRVNYITLIDKDSKEHTVDWDSTGYVIESGDYSAEYEGVYVDEKYANGHLDIFRNAVSFRICADNADTEEKDEKFTPYLLTIEDGSETYEVPLEQITVEDVDPVATRKNIAQTAWDMLGDVPIDSEDCITEDFLQFPAGTSRFDIWEWLESGMKEAVYKLK